MRSLLLAATMVAISAPAAYAQAAPKFSTATSTINDLVANPEAKAVLQKHMAPIVDMAGQVGGLTLKGLQGMAGDQIPDSLLAAIDADLAKIK